MGTTTPIELPAVNRTFTSEECSAEIWSGEVTHYKSLRYKASSELGIKEGVLAANSITALAEGANIFAESIFGLSEYPSKIEKIKKYDRT